MIRRQGFTLIELLIVAAVFSLVALVSTTVITRIQSTQRQILGKQRVVADGRYVLETVARSVRQEFINYDYYYNNNWAAGPAGYQTTLALKDSSGIETCYRLDSVANPLNIQVVSGASVVNCNGAVWIDITPNDLVIDDFHVYITPGSDPFMSVPQKNQSCHQQTPIGNPVTEGFDSTHSICACSFTTALTDCFADQPCISTTTGTAGNTCGAGDTSCICQNANEQPQVTIVIATRTLNQSAGEQARSVLQTTVASHLYRR